MIKREKIIYEISKLLKVIADYKSLLKESEKAYLFTWRSPVNCKRIFDLSWFLPAYMAYLIGSLLVKTDLVIR